MINELSTIEFNFKMDMINLEQCTVNNIIRERFNGIQCESNYDVINESIVETVKKAILALFEKIRGLILKIIGFFKKKKNSEETKKVEQTIEKTKKKMESSPKEATNNTSTIASDTMLYKYHYKEVYGKSKDIFDMEDIQELIDMVSDTKDSLVYDDELQDDLKKVYSYDRNEFEKEFGGSIGSDDSELNNFISDIENKLYDICSALDGKFSRQDIKIERSSGSINQKTKDIIMSSLSTKIKPKDKNEIKSIFEACSEDYNGVKKQTDMIISDLEKAYNKLKRIESDYRTSKIFTEINSNALKKFQKFNVTILNSVADMLMLQTKVINKIISNTEYNIKTCSKCLI